MNAELVRLSKRPDRAEDFARLRLLAAASGLPVEKLALVMSRAVPAIASFVHALNDAANAVHRVAGLEGRYAVRAGLDPAYATPDALDGLLRGILDGTAGANEYERAEIMLLSPASRAAVAAAALQGWTRSYLDAACRCALTDWSPRCPVDRHRAYARALGGAA